MYPMSTAIIKSSRPFLSRNILETNIKINNPTLPKPKMGFLVADPSLNRLLSMGLTSFLRDLISASSASLFSSIASSSSSTVVNSHTQVSGEDKTHSESPSPNPM
jgi:hypothetical protein